MHWNGSEWAEVATPNVTKGTNRLEAVLALSPNNAWAVGFFTPANADREPKRTLILHWDGKTWKVVPSPNVGPKTHSPSNGLSGLTANSANDIWAFGCHFAAGGSGRFRTLVLHWDGKSWKVVPSPNPTKGFVGDVLFSGVVPSPGNVWIFGIRARSAQCGNSCHPYYVRKLVLVAGFQLRERAGEDARRVLPLNKNIFWNWETLPDQRRRLLSFFREQKLILQAMNSESSKTFTTQRPIQRRNCETYI
jgi:hypothetical protein